MTRARAVALAVVASYGLGACSDDEPQGYDTRVTFAAAGDTIVVEGPIVVRLIGVDSPEPLSSDAPAECYGAEAGDFVRSLLARGEEVTLVGDLSVRDNQDRAFAYVYRRSDGLFVNEQVLRNGYGTFVGNQPDPDVAEQLQDAAEKARDEQLGLFSAC